MELEEGKGDEGMSRHHVISEDGSPEGALMATEDQKILAKALEDMPEACRRIISLRYYRQMSYQEICGVLELPLGTVCSRLKRCLSKLKGSIFSAGGL